MHDTLHIPTAPTHWGWPLFKVLLLMFVVNRGWRAWRRFWGDARPLYGAARFASTAEIRLAGLYAAEGIFLGRRRGRDLIFGGQQFVFVAAPTRSGKGAGIVIPNLLSFTDSVVVLDIKGENFDVTAGWRAAAGQRVFRLSPFARDGRSHRYNPLDALSDDPERSVQDALALGEVLYPRRSGDDFWNGHARNLFVALTLYVCQRPGLPRTLAEVQRQAAGTDRPLRAHLQSLMRGDEAAADGLPALSAPCREAFGRVLSNSDGAFAGIVAAFNAPLTVFADPQVAAATAVSDFSLEDVRRKRTSIYFSIPANRLGAGAVLVNLFFAQLIEANTHALPAQDPTLRHSCLVVLDEMPAIGRLAVLDHAVGFLAGYNLRLLCVAQSGAQLASVYGPLGARHLTTNHAVQVIFAPREQEDAEAFARALGEETVESSTVSSRGLGATHTVSSQAARRPLMLAQEIKALGADRAIILAENCRPILAEKIRYYREERWRARLLPPPVVPKLSIAAGTDSGVAHAASHAAGEPTGGR